MTTLYNAEAGLPIYLDSKGQALKGSIYFGVPNLNPVTNPVTVYWDAAGTQPAMQPVAVSNGRTVRTDGTPSRVWISGDYSMLVVDSKGGQVDFQTNQQTPAIPTTETVDKFSGTGAPATYTLSVTPQSINDTSVFVGGVYQQKSSYTLAGNQLTITAAVGTNNVEVNTAQNLDWSSIASTLNTAAATAQTNATAAAASRAQMLYIVQGSFAPATPPTHRDDGSAIQAGDYASFTDNTFRRYNGSTWVASDISSAALAAPTGSSLFGTVQAGTGAVARTGESKLRDIYSVKDTGASSDGTTNDATAVAQAIANSPQAGKLLVPFDTFVGTARVANVDGVRFTGQGLVKYTPSATLGNRVQQPAGRDSYAWGAEYLYKFLVKLRALSATTIRISGDSTVGNLGVALGYLVQNIPLCTLTPVTNSGKSTADWISTYLAADIAAANDVLIWHWGMNDACAGVGTPTTMAQFESNLRSGLATYRASVPVGSGGIILMTPNASSDGTNGRDEYRNEKMRQIIRNAAEDYQCAYFDTYSAFQDGYVGIGSWLDNTYSDGLRGIHPQSAFAAAIAGGLFDLLVPKGVQQVIGGFNNCNGLGDGRLPGDAISVYEFGVSVWRAPLTNGWPVDGWVYTFRENRIGSSCFQIIHCYNVDVAPLIRTGISSGTWGSWRRLGFNKNIDGTSTTAGTVPIGTSYNWFDANTAAAAFNLTLPAPIDGDKLTVVFNNATGVMTFTPTAPATNVTRLPTTAIPAKTPFTMIYNAGNTAWYPA